MCKFYKEIYIIYFKHNSLGVRTDHRLEKKKKSFYLSMNITGLETIPQIHLHALLLLSGCLRWCNVLYILQQHSIYTAAENWGSRRHRPGCGVKSTVSGVTVWIKVPFMKELESENGKKEDSQSEAVLAGSNGLKITSYKGVWYIFAILTLTALEATEPLTPVFIMIWQRT